MTHGRRRENLELEICSCLMSGTIKKKNLFFLNEDGKEGRHILMDSLFLVF